MKKALFPSAMVLAAGLVLGGLWAVGLNAPKAKAGGVSLGPSVQKTVVVANAGTTSTAANLDDRRLCGVHIPAGMEGTTVAFQTSTTLAGTYVSVRDKTGAAVSVTVTTAIGQYLPVDSDIFDGIQFLRVVLASQTGDITLTLFTR